VKLIRPLAPALVILALPAVALAQTLRVPRVEIGAEAGLVGAIGEGLHVRPIAGPRLTLNLSQQHAIELSADTLFAAGPGLYGLYFVQYKRTTRLPPDRSRIRPFFTVGTGGYYSHRKVREQRVPRLDGSVVVYPAHSRGELSRPILAAFGGGFERRLTRSASFRLEGTGFALVDSDGFLGFRVHAGISVPIGGYRANPMQ
jgi:hypothetical protein